MPVYEIPFLTERDDVLRILGYKDVKTVLCDVFNELETVIEKIGKIITPKVFYREFKFTADDKGKRLVIEDRKALSGEYVYNSLHAADYLIIAVSTLGEELDRLCEAYFNEKDYLKGLMVDAIGISMLSTLNRTFWMEMAKEAELKGLGISKRICPGTNNWNLSDQRVIFDLIDKDISGLSLNESFMISPMKSDTSVLGVGKEMGSKVFHDCESCGLKHCQFKLEETGQHMLKIHKGDKTVTLQAKHGTNLLSFSRENGFLVYNACGGNGTCGKCKVWIKSRIMPKISAQERKHLRQEEIEMGIRLACLVDIYTDLEIYLDKAPQNPKILVEGIFKNQGIYSNLKGDTGSGKSDYGIAFDIGTTTIAAYLVDLNTGNVVDTFPALNPQRFYGADIVSRINHTIIKEDGLAVLQNLVVEELNNMIGRLADKNLISRDSIYKLVAVGNTTMLHLLWGVSCSGIAVAPFIPTFTDMRQNKASDINLQISEEGHLITLPCKSGYVGADTIAAVLACGMYKDKDICLLLDIGTNGELVLGNNERMLCCAAAAGPAFEGANIRYGMGAVEGAIDHIKLDNGIEYTTIGEGKARGICGSGIVDAVAELVRVGLVDASGRMMRKNELSEHLLERFSNNLSEEDGKRLFVLDRESGVCVTQADIRELQLAKTAIYAGIKVLTNTMGIKLKDIKKIYMAGGFGNFIDISNAIAIKLLPDEHQHKICHIGNAAGAGAVMALISGDMLQETDSIQSLLEYIELSGLTLFETEFIDNMGF